MVRPQFEDAKVAGREPGLQGDGARGEGVGRALAGRGALGEEPGLGRGGVRGEGVDGLLEDGGVLEHQHLVDALGQRRQCHGSDALPWPRP